MQFSAHSVISAKDHIAGIPRTRYIINIITSYTLRPPNLLQTDENLYGACMEALGRTVR